MHVEEYITRINEQLETLKEMSAGEVEKEELDSQYFTFEWPDAE
ncbi:hypothetical protein [Alteribacillus iranensis]|uniref:Uncharacterized protein n=1 Tax=Alteribacillus iranensis TaxID=930128 RepID=A0A1I2C4I0_9BACI|nr:hypothetical protein [Alteribacillus iranensis]SFE63237.1 hypothetical protein SAMN05192532_102704 [Alteribacillus iranensis]